MTTEIEKPAAVAFPEYQGNENWAELTAGAITTKGADLLDGIDLTGVPFVVTSATFRLGDALSLVTNEIPYYVSLEIVAGNEAAFAQAKRRKRITDQCPVVPGERLVFNEGGTGVYRQVVGLMESLGWIRLPDGPEGGAYGESRLDTSPEKWEILSDSVRHNVGPSGKRTFTADIRIYAERGIRVSEYENKFTKEGATRYLA
jgi:hypothetical protein